MNDETTMVVKMIKIDKEAMGEALNVLSDQHWFGHSLCKYLEVSLCNYITNTSSSLYKSSVHSNL